MPGKRAGPLCRPHFIRRPGSRRVECRTSATTGSPGVKAPVRRNTDSRKSPPIESGPRINPENPVAAPVAEMVRDEKSPVPHKDGPVEITQDEVTGKPEIIAQEWIGNRSSRSAG